MFLSEVNSPMYTSRTKQFYDILYNGEEYVIVCPWHTKRIVGDDWQMFQCKHKNTTLYTKKAPFTENIILEKYVNMYPTFRDEIIMATCVKDSDRYIIQWIEFHMKLGVTRFVIYDNGGMQSQTKRLLEWYIQQRIVLLIYWPFRPLGHPWQFQAIQMAHTVNAFRFARYIGLLDIDEYVVSKVPLTELFERDCKHGGHCLRSKFFYNSNNAPEYGYDFLKIYNCEEKPRQNEYQKAFVCPKNMRIFCIHEVSVGMPVKYRDDIHMNHYIFLDKSTRGREKVTGFDDSIKGQV